MFDDCYEHEVADPSHLHQWHSANQMSYSFFPFLTDAQSLSAEHYSWQFCVNILPLSLTRPSEPALIVFSSGRAGVE